MSQVRDLYEMIQDIIYEEVTYLRHYIGEVVNNIDPVKKGRVQITIPEIGLDNPSLAVWCFPRQGHGMSVPDIGKYAEVYFINGDRAKPVYLYPASEIINNIPTKFNGLPTTHIIHESPKSKSYIKHNDLLDKFSMKNRQTSLLFELQLDVDAMTELQSAISGWTPVANDGGAALKTALSSFLSFTMADFTLILEEG